MTHLLALLGLSLSLAANAAITPRVGNFASFDLVIKLQNETATATQSSELVQFDPTKNSYLEKTDYHLKDEAKETQEDWKSTSTYLTDEYIQEILKNCKARGGVYRVLKVPAGTFPACGIKTKDEKYDHVMWVGLVPFGSVKRESYRRSDGLTSIAELRSFK